MKKNLEYILSPVLVLALITVVFIKNDLFPLGPRTLSWCDMTQQVVPLLADFKDILAGNANMFLNMGNAGGMDFIGIFFFFLSSPFTFLVALVQKQDLLLFMNILVVLKMLVCAFTASFFFKKVFPALKPAFNIALSAMYAFSGFALMFYQNVVWLDMMYLFPLLMLSLRAIVKEKKLWPYTVTFAAVLVVNYYLSYMVCLFILLGFYTYTSFCCGKAERREHILRLTVGTLYALLITAAVWLPALMQYLESARGESVLSNLAIMPTFFNIDTKLPIVYATSIMVPAVYLFAQNRSIERKNKKTLLVLLFLLVIPLILEPVNIMWHAGSYQGFPARYGDITSFLILVTAAFVLNRQDAPQKSDTTCLWISVGILLECVVFQFLWLADNKTGLTAYTQTLWGDEQSFSLLSVSAVVFALTYGVLLFFYSYRTLAVRTFSVFLLVLMAVEAIFNGCVYIGSSSDPVQRYKDIMSLSGQITDTGFYRVKNDRKYFPSNLMGALGYNSLSHYTSLTNKDYMAAMKQLGYSSYWMEVNSDGGSVFTDGLLCNKYVVSELYETVYGEFPETMTKQYNIYRNPYFMPLGQVVDTDLSGCGSLPAGSRMDAQQYVYQSLFGEDRTFTQKYDLEYSDNVDVQEQNGGAALTLQDTGLAGTLEYIVDVGEEEVLYFDCYTDMGKTFGHPILDSLSISVDGEELTGDYPKQDENGLLELGKFKNQTVTIDVTVYENISAQSFGLWGLKTGALNGLPRRDANLTAKGNMITGTASAQKDGQYLFIAVPYRDGFTAEINGKPAEIERVFGAFMAVRLEAGENTVGLKYVSKGVGLGFILSVVGILAFAVSIWLSKRGGYRRIAFLEWPAYILFFLLFVAAVLAVYVLPVFLKIIQT